VRWILLLVMMAATGCGPTRVAAPTYDPDGMAKAAMVEYDSNNDGKLDAGELVRCPALLRAFPQIVTDKRPYMTEEDLAERFRLMQESRAGLIGTRCMVTRDGKGVSGVTVTFIPEEFMGNAIKRGSGISDADGRVELAIEGERVKGLNPGYYRIEASLKDESGNETLPANVNKDSKLGQEIHPRNRRQEVCQISLDR